MNLEQAILVLNKYNYTVTFLSEKESDDIESSIVVNSVNERFYQEYFDSNRDLIDFAKKIKDGELED